MRAGNNGPKDILSIDVCLPKGDLTNCSTMKVSTPIAIIPFARESSSLLFKFFDIISLEEGANRCNNLTRG